MNTQQPGRSKTNNCYGETAAECQYFHCYFCGGKLNWDSDSEPYEDDDVAIETYYTCTNCGREYTITDPNKEGREYYNEYWHEKK